MVSNRKYRKIQVEVYKCERCTGLPWLQRGIVNKKGEIILKRPNNCTHCKSPSWQKPRNE